MGLSFCAHAENLSLQLWPHLVLNQTFLFEPQLKSFELSPLTIQSSSGNTVHIDTDTAQIVQSALNCLCWQCRVWDGKRERIKN